MHARLWQKVWYTKTYENYIDMLENEHLDFISVCTPNYLHKPVTLEALKEASMFTVRNLLP